MPVYEYFCPACNGRFRHLAKRIDAPPPPCPGCGSRDVYRLVSTVHAGRSDAERQAELGARSRQVDGNDPQEIARFLQQAGSLGEEYVPVEREAFREIIARRAEGASDQDLQYVVDAIPFEGYHAGHDHAPQQADDTGDSSHTHDHGHGHESSPRRARDLGWA